MADSAGAAESVRPYLPAMTPLTRPVCGRTAGTVRPGHRPGGPWTQAVHAVHAVHAVLCHLEGARSESPPGLSVMTSKAGR